SFLMPDKEILLEAVTVELTISPDTADLTPADALEREQRTAEQVPMFTGDTWQQVPLVPRSALSAGESLEGPAIIAETTSTTVVEPGWVAEVTTEGNLLLEIGRASCRERG